MFSRKFKISLSVFMAFLMTHIPAVAAEEKLVSTSEWIFEVESAQAQENIQTFLTESKVREAFLKRGLSPEEVSQRLASLSPMELKQLSQQVDQIRAGGDILFTILIVVLIIFLIKRM